MANDTPATGMSRARTWDEMESDTWSEGAAEELPCPWCGHEIRDLWDYSWGSREEIAVECPECDKPITIAREVSVSYTGMRRKSEGTPALSAALVGTEERELAKEVAGTVGRANDPESAGRVEAPSGEKDGKAART